MFPNKKLHFFKKNLKISSYDAPIYNYEGYTSGGANAAEVKLGSWE